MTNLLDHAVATVRGLPPDVQDDLARVLLQLAGQEQPVVQLNDADETSFALSLDQANRGEFASEKKIEAIWAKHGL